jgi:hypothetical protein
MKGPSVGSLSVRPHTVPAVGGSSQDRMNAIRLDDRELSAQLVCVLNELQTANERCRAALIDGNLPVLVELGRVISNRGASLMVLARP